MDPNFYRFRSVWRLEATPNEVYLALERLEDYPTWWPEVRQIERLDDDAAKLTCRSILPYDLVFVTRQARRDPQEFVLEAAMTGDLEGFSRWTIASNGNGRGTQATFDEEVVTNKEMLRKLARVARPAFKANHTLMMHHGRRGLATYLAGFRAGRSSRAE